MKSNFWKTKYLAVILIFIFGDNLFAQKVLPDREKINVEDVLNFEKKLKSRMYKNDPNISFSISPSLCPAASDYKLEQPLRFSRIAKKKTSIDSNYYFTNDDLTIRCATYTMSLESIGRGYNDKGDISSEYNSEFDKIVYSLSEDFGEPSEFDKVQKEYIAYGTTFLKREAKWDKDYMTLEIRLNPGTKRLRITQYWK